MTSAGGSDADATPSPTVAVGRRTRPLLAQWLPAGDGTLLHHTVTLLAVTPPPATCAPTPMTPVPRTDDRNRLIERVRALLRKAESTSFPAEAEALTAKAQDLLTRHALDEALLDVTVDGRRPVVRRVEVEGAYSSGRAMLLGAVGHANRCVAVWDPAASVAMLVGFAVDLDATELLWGSLVAQGEAAVRAAGPQRDQRGRSRTRSWRAAFWVAFAQRIGQRLEEVAAATTAEVAHTAGDLAPVLASRQRDVDAAVRQHFPRLTRRRARVSNGEGWAAGHQAADRADLAARRPVGGRRSLPR